MVAEGRAVLDHIALEVGRLADRVGRGEGEGRAMMTERDR
jgi:hypothetical protein